MFEPRGDWHQLLLQHLGEEIRVEQLNRAVLVRRLGRLRIKYRRRASTGRTVGAPKGTNSSRKTVCGSDRRTIQSSGYRSANLMAIISLAASTRLGMSSQAITDQGSARARRQGPNTVPFSGRSPVLVLEDWGVQTF